MDYGARVPMPCNRDAGLVTMFRHGSLVLIGVAAVSGCGSTGPQNSGDPDGHVAMRDGSAPTLDTGLGQESDLEAGSRGRDEASALQDVQAQTADSDTMDHAVAAETSDADLDGTSGPADAGGATSSSDGSSLHDVATDGQIGDSATGSSSQGDAGAPRDGASDGPETPSADASASSCVGGWTGKSSVDTSSPTPASGYGGVQVKIPTTAQIVGLHTILSVPAKPPASGTLFLWPGLQPLPNSVNYNPIGNGVLQPVLTWGGTCAPNSPRSNVFASWWISGQYVNTYANYAGHTGCNGGEGMDVAVDDSLDITMSLAGTIWQQVVVDQQSGQQVSYDIDMLGQAQDWAIFSIEGHNQEPITDVVFTSTTLTLSSRQTSSCQPSVRGLNDYFSVPMASSDGLECCISRIVLRAQGVAATTPNGP